MPSLGRIDHVHIHVADRDRAEAWCAEVLGLQRIEAYAFWDVDGGPLTLGNADGSVHLALFERPAGRCTVAFGVSGAAFVAWREHLARVLPEAPEAFDHEVSWSMYVNDLDGNVFEITTYDHGEVTAANQKA